MSSEPNQSSSYKVLRSHIGDSWDVEIIGPDGEITLKPGFHTRAEAERWVSTATAQKS
jgi:hypothetical protein